MRMDERDYLFGLLRSTEKRTACSCLYWMWRIGNYLFPKNLILSPQCATKHTRSWNTNPPYMYVCPTSTIAVDLSYGWCSTAVLFIFILSMMCQKYSFPAKFHRHPLIPPPNSRVFQRAPHKQRQSTPPGHLIRVGKFDGTEMIDQHLNRTGEESKDKVLIERMVDNQSHFSSTFQISMPFQWNVLTIRWRAGKGCGLWTGRGEITLNRYLKDGGTFSTVDMCRWRLQTLAMADESAVPQDGFGGRNE